MEISQDATSHLLKALQHHFLLIKGHSYKTLNAFYCHIFLNPISEVFKLYQLFLAAFSFSPFSGGEKSTKNLTCEKLQKCSFCFTRDR